MNGVRVLVEADVDAEALRAATESARKAAVLELYGLGRITSGRGAALLGIGRAEFLDLAGEHGIATMQLTPAELDEEASKIRR
jgi:hypothetical protein